MAEPVRARKSRKSDHIAGAIILCILAAIGIGVYRMGDSAPMETLSLAPVRASDAFEPPSGLLEGYALAGRRRYDADNLYEYIDGEAPRYVQFGFKSLASAEYERFDLAHHRSAGEPGPLVVDVYDMGGRRNAFGIFADSRPLGEPALALGNEGHASGNAAAFWKGRFYVRVAALTETDAGTQVLAAARAAAAWIKDDARTLRELAVFPRDGLVEGSLTYMRSGAFGLEHLAETFAGDYKRADGSYRLFFSDLGGAEQARETLRRHAEFLRENGSIEAVLLEGPERLLWGSDRYLGSTFLISRGGLVAGSFGLDDRAQAERRAREILAGVEEALGGAPEGGTDGGS